MRPSEIRDLFPELSSEADVRRLVTSVSGDLLARARAPIDRTGRLRSLGALCADVVPDGPAAFDAFARGFCERFRPAGRAAFEGSPLTRDRAAALTGDLLDWLTERAQQVALRTLVVILHQLRDAGALRGGSPEERFWYFCRISAEPRFRRTVLEVFPELNRQLTALAGNGVDHVRAMLDATTRAIASGAVPGPGPADPVPPRLTRVDYGLGDTHARGQSVCRLTFDGDHTLVYKPRPMAIERAFGHFVTRINAAAGTRLPVLRVWCGADRGWQEYADRADPEPGDAYFRACGHLLAVLHLLRASDMHYENVLNHRGLPVVVDAESLFSVNRRAGTAASSSAEMEALAQTVFSVGLLPSRLADPARQERSVDIGFLGYTPGQEAVTTSPILADFGTDQARVTFASGSLDAPSVRPDSLPRATELDLLCRGFTEVYDWATAHRTMVEGWIRELFGAVPIRSVLDATSKYYKLLQTGSHPVFQQSTALKKLLYHRTGIGRLEHVTPPVIRAEISDLLQGDVPYFTLRTDATEVFHWDGAPVADVLDAPPMANVVAGVQELSPHARDRNLRIIRASYVDKTGPECDAPDYRPGPSARRPDVDAATRQIVAAIAAELHDDAVIARDGRVAWIGATISNTAREFPWRVDGLGDDLYAGVPGLALFLAAAGVLLDETRHRDLAEQALRPRAEALLRDPASRRERITGGLAGGYPGLAFALVEAGRLGGSSELVRLGGRLWGHVAEDLAGLTDTDFLMGSTGLLAGSLHVAAALAEWGLPAGPARAAADAAFAHLVAGVDLRPPGPGQLVYTGFSHGTSGALAALARYASVTSRGAGPLAELTAVHEGLHTDPGRGWPISSLTDETARGWCHGSPGVLLGVCERLDAGAGPVAHPPSRPEHLARVVMRTGFGLNLSLCHGDIGNLTILDRAARFDGSGAVADFVAARRADLCLRIVPDMLAARVGKSVVNDSLYVGLAGIGYGLIALSGLLPVASPLALGAAAGSPAAPAAPAVGR
ncbi:type 2 lanthipeptide synthetase LanM [Rhizomonospora bruguierae]|uniref:type 2 lanthipeptide synthetase LanM n=1 Tax=Rhizomonospora bruguierae TaxID=1581705 RepID=UPI001BCC2141|nr:type 2 lanthipeptide synthetase LanM [Micromonospora sp. NBRC 107566]